MKCENPYIKGQMGEPIAFRCGTCLPCRLHRRRIWTHRILLESMLYVDNCFVTLTYAPEHIVLSDTGLPNLVPKHAQDFLKRIRKMIEPRRIRYFMCGEYGDKNEGPHYHLALFNYPNCSYGMSRYKYKKDCCNNCDTIRDAWGKGHVFLGQLERKSAQYIAGYVTKKMTKADDIRLNGRHPEFARMSLRPGIGHDFMFEQASTTLEFNLDRLQGDVPSSLRHGSHSLPLGRYLTRKLRKMSGLPEDTPPLVLEKMKNEMQILLKDYLDVEELPEKLPYEIKKAALKSHIQDAGKVLREKLESRMKIHKRRSEL